MVLTALLAAMTFCALSVPQARAVAIVNSLLVRLEGDQLHISAPHLDFLSGKAVERLKDGVSLAFIGQLSITSAPNAVVADAVSSARFALSYDIWEQRFTVDLFGDRPEARRSISHLSAEATELWCLDNLTLNQAQLPSDRPFYVHLDLRADDPRDQLGIVGEAGINITRLIEIFSRPVRANQQQWPRSAGPFRLADLRKAARG